MRCKARVESLDDAYLKTCRVMDWECIYRIRDMLDAHGMGLLMPFAPPSFVTPEVPLFSNLRLAAPLPAANIQHSFLFHGFIPTCSRCCVADLLAAASAWEGATFTRKMSQAASMKRLLWAEQPPARISR